MTVSLVINDTVLMICN